MCAPTLPCHIKDILYEVNELGTPTVLAKGARTVTIEPFFPNTGGKMALNIVPCYNCNGKGGPVFVLSYGSKGAALNIYIVSDSSSG